MILLFPRFFFATHNFSQTQIFYKQGFIIGYFLCTRDKNIAWLHFSSFHFCNKYLIYTYSIEKIVNFYYYILLYYLKNN